MDFVDQKTRSRMMGAIRQKGTAPELVVRRVAHKIGLRFRLHKVDLPGKPDLVLPKHRVAIFVNGCFWHRHPGCRKATIPASNRSFWLKKLTNNVKRDAANEVALAELGWRSLTIWECQTRNLPGIAVALRTFINHPAKSHD